MEIDVLVDTALFIAHTRRTKGSSRLDQAIDYYKLGNPAVSVVTKFEYELGELRAKRMTRFEAVFPAYRVLPLNDSIWQRALHIQNFSSEVNARMELADLLIASTAVYLAVPLLTLNFDHFAHLQASRYRLRLPKIP